VAFRFARDMSKQDGAWVRNDYPLPTTRQANRRRLYVFLGTLVAALVIGLTYTWIRPAEYRASARLEITPGTDAPPVLHSTPQGAVETTTPESARPFLTELQVLTSRPVLEVAVARLERAGERVSEGAADPIANLQSRLEAVAVPNTNVVELVATGPRPEILAPVLTTIVDVYRQHLADAFRVSSAEATAKVEEEVRKLKEDLTTKRRDVEAFRQRHNIVSLEREENQILAQTRTLSSALGNANESVAKADGKLRALTESAAAGKAVTRAKDDPTLANLEQRASQLREQLSDLNRDFTLDFLAKDPKVSALRVRLAELDRQIAAQREVSQRNALAEARDEFATAQGTVARIQHQIATGQKELAQFTARFNEYKSQQDQLNAIEVAYQDASRRLAKQEATVRGRTPTLTLLEPPAMPREPWRPNYWRDTAISIVASFVLALLAMWLVELFNRTEPRPAVVVLQGHGVGVPQGPPASALGWQGSPAGALEASAPALLPQPTTLPRELAAGEVAALVDASDDDSRLAELFLLSGISLAEALALRWSDVDLGANRIHVGGGAQRNIVVREPLPEMLAARAAAPTGDPVLGQPDRPASADTIRAQLLCGAHDAGIDNAIEVTPECLRHTYIAFLVRQGIRFADLTALVGHLPAEVLGAYSALSPPGPRHASAAINVVFPVKGFSR
jgi:uncharacterized protein involved in exopolysaccharide biosynthesis